MGKAIEVNGVVKQGHFQFGSHGTQVGSVNQIVHDGDTVTLRTALNFSSRFLGIDTPEVSFNIRNDSFISLGNSQWTQFFVSGAWQNDLPVPADLMNFLTARIGDPAQVAANHFQHSQKAAKSLEAFIQADLTETGKTKDNFEFFLAFGYEILDGYGRLLCYLHADRKNFSPAQEKLSYNELQLASGTAVPYFIYPNIQPFLKIDPFEQTVSNPTGFWTRIDNAGRLQAARNFVATARAENKGIFDAADPLRLLPYELRFIARKNTHGPDRYVIDLGNSGSNGILKPEHYYKIQNYEDRLFIPKEFVPLFTGNGWTIQ
jgi:endonuclease YncB( thermonuclease family)